MLQMKNMSFVMGIKLRIYPTNEQKSIIAINAGAARFVYNRLVARNKELFLLRKTGCFVEPIKNRINYLESLGESSAAFKESCPFLTDSRIDSLAIANAVQNYHKAWKQFKAVPGTSIPTFHKKGYSASYQTNAQYQKDAALISDGNVYLTDIRHIKLPKLGSIRFKGSNRIYKIFERSDTRIGTITVSKDECNQYFVSLQIGSTEPFHKTAKTKQVSKDKINSPDELNVIGIDLNLDNFYTDSDGVVVDNPRYRKKVQARLAMEQRKLSERAERAKKDGRSLKDSKNYQKQRIKVAKLHKKAAAQMKDFQNRLSKMLVESQDIICIEDLKVKNMIKNHKLSRAIADASWSQFINMLVYKSRIYGTIVVKVPPQNTTQTCSSCGYVLTGEEKLTLEDREWICPCCGTKHNRDHNSAINIKIKGLEILFPAA